MKELSVIIGGQKIGILSQNMHGRMNFNYNSDSKRIISLSMKDTTISYSHNICEAYFGGLLPENETTKKLIATKYHISSNNSFSLLEAIGADCAGAIAFYADNGISKYSDKYPLRGYILSKKTLGKLIYELPQKPLLTGIVDIRLSLAGVQDKTSVCMINGKFASPVKNCPTTHIIKPEIKGFRSSVENEYFCLTLAKMLGLESAKVSIEVVNEIKFLLIERFDRKYVKINNIEFISRIHQEDFCQALGVRSSLKYQNEGGPGIFECLNIIQATSKPALNITHFIQYLVFNLIIGNNDAHAKNYSIFHHNDGSIALAPLYDALCTTIYDTLSKKVAMKIGNTYLFSDIKKSDFETISEKGGFNIKLIQNTLAQFNKKIDEACNMLINDMQNYDIKLDIEFVRAISQLILKNLERLDKVFY